MSLIINRVSKAGLWIFLCLCLMAGTSFGQDEPVARSGQVVTSGEADVGGAFVLTDHNGDRVTHEDLKGKPQLIYFGFGYCPDVCPFDLQRLGAALAKADPKGEIYRPVFITIDPERDTVESLSLYVASNGFPKGLIGLTGTQAEIDIAKIAYKAYAQKTPDAENAAGYTFNHSNLIYLMDKEGKFVELFSSSQSVDTIAKRLSSYQGKSGRLKKALLVATLIFVSLVFILLGRMGRNALKTTEPPMSPELSESSELSEPKS